MEDQKQEELLTNSDIVVKYKTAAAAANKALAAVVAACKAGALVVDLCEIGDKTIEKEVSTAFKNNKEMQKGIAFPTCVSANHVAGHLSPEAGDKTALKDGDVVKIDMGAHVDGFLALVAHTVVVGVIPGAPVTGKAADVMCAAHIAGEAVLRLLKPGKTNKDITPYIQKIADVFHVTPVEGVLSHQVSKYIIDGTNIIMNKSTPEQQPNECTINANDVWTIDIVMSTGTGKTKELEVKPTIYKRVPEQNKMLKLQAARKLYSEINKKFPSLPFTIRAIEEKHIRFGLTEMEKSGLLTSYPVLYEKEGEIIAQYKFTALVGPGGASKITEHPLPLLQSQYSVQDDELKQLLAEETGMKKKKPAKKQKTEQTTTTSAKSEAAPMEVDK